MNEHLMRDGAAPRPARPARGAGGPAASVSVRAYRSGLWTVVEVAHEMDVQAIPLIADLVSRDAPWVVFDLSKVTFMDASGLGLLVDTQRRAVAAGGCLRLVSPSHSVRTLLEMTGCSRVFPTFDSCEQAVSTPPDAGRTQVY
jgi:anti-anti-sigma factor